LKKCLHRFVSTRSSRDRERREAIGTDCRERRMERVAIPQAVH
jgi:hypothetical protein